MYYMDEGMHASQRITSVSGGIGKEKQVSFVRTAKNRSSIKNAEPASVNETGASDRRNVPVTRTK